MIELNEANAIAYVKEHLIGLGYEPVIKGTERHPEGVIVVRFTLPDSEIEHIFDVWVENDKLYGEW